jgi:transcription initiation factor IIE alpha subunit
MIKMLVKSISSLVTSTGYYGPIIWKILESNKATFLGNTEILEIFKEKYTPKNKRRLWSNHIKPTIVRSVLNKFYELNLVTHRLIKTKNAYEEKWKINGEIHLKQSVMKINNQLLNLLEQKKACLEKITFKCTCCGKLVDDETSLNSAYCCPKCNSSLQMFDNTILVKEVEMAMESCKKIT